MLGSTSFHILASYYLPLKTALGFQWNIKLTMKSINRSAISIFGTEDFLSWVKTVCPELHRWTLDELNHHPSVYLVDGEDQNCWGDCFAKYHKEIFRDEVGLYVPQGEKFPEVSLELFRRWFTFIYHGDTFDLSDKEIKVYDD